MDKLEQVSKDPSLKEEMEAEVTSTESKAGSGSVAGEGVLFLNTKAFCDCTKCTLAIPGWASWAVGAIGAKFYKSSTPKPQQQQQQSQQQQEQKPSDSSRKNNDERGSGVSEVSDLTVVRLPASCDS